MQNKHISDVRNTKLSVPQGGCLSTILFLVFINNIFKVIIFGILYLFADDNSCSYSQNLKWARS
jgi:hypothetical protein